MKTSKWFLLFLAVCLVFSLAACGGGGGGSDDPSGGGGNPVVNTTPLTFTALAAGSTVSTTNQGGTVANTPSLEYSTDGENWEPFTLNTGDDATNTKIILANVGDKVYLRATGTNDSFSADDGYIKFTMTGSIAASGNIMSLVDKECKSTVIPSKLCFYCLFANCGVVLTSAPELPATTLKDSCYADMFYGCKSLVSAPELPATTLATGCYDGMFAECSALTTVPTLPATTLAEYCYSGMFDNCTSLVNAPEIKATSLPEGSCYGMFIRCSALEKITVHFTDWNTAGQATNNWVMDTTAGGHFYCPAGLIDRTEDDSKIPTGWTVHDLP